MMVQMAASNTLIQTIVDEDKRGRVMSFYTMAFFGMMPFGSLIAGWAGARIGAPATVAWGGLATMVAVALFVRAAAGAAPAGAPDLRAARHLAGHRQGAQSERRAHAAAGGVIWSASHEPLSR